MADEAVLHWGICGAGKISSDFCQAMSTLSRFKREHKIVAVAARSKSEAEKFANKFGYIEKAYGAYEKLAKDPEIEIVYIGVINTEHVRLSLMMLEAGKHVICEKPLAPSWKECKKVMDFAKKKKLFFIEAVWSRFFPVYKQLKNEIVSGRLGEVNMVTAQLGAPVMSMERVRRKDLIGGCLLDIGIYCVQFVTHIYGELPEKIVATGSLTDEGVDEDGCVIMLFSGNRKANITYSGKTPVGHNCATVMGTEDKIFIEDMFWCPKSIQLPSGKVENKLPNGDYFYPHSSGLRYDAAHAHDIIKKRGEYESPLYGYKDIELVHKIMEEILNQIGYKC